MTRNTSLFGFGFGFKLPHAVSRIQLFAAGAVAAPGGDGGGGGGTPAAAPPASGQGAPPTGQGSNNGGTNNGGGTPPPNGANGSGTPPGQGANGNAENIAILRQSHETLNRMGGAEKVQAIQQAYTKIHSTALGLAEQLGYTPESFEEAFTQDPIAIHNHLIAEARQAAQGRGNGNGQGNGNNGQQPTFREVLNREVAPLRNFVQNQMAERANNMVDGEFKTQFDSHVLFKDKQVPPDVRNAIYDHFTDLVKADDAAQLAVIRSGDVSKLKVHFDTAVANMIKYAQAYNKWSTGTGAGQGDGGGGNGGQGNGGQNGGQQGQNGGQGDPFKGMTLDNIINGDPNADALASMRGFRTS